jgi:hypothetical protein
MADLTRTAANVRDAMPQKRDVINVRLAEAVERGHVGYQLTDGTFGIADADATGKHESDEGGRPGRVGPVRAQL